MASEVTSTSSVDDQIGDASDVIRKNPDLEIAQLRFLVGCSDLDSKRKREAEQQLMAGIKEHQVGTTYRGGRYEAKWRTSTPRRGDIS